jgi:hypothetical protein
MTPDQKIAVWAAALTALPTMVFTGVVAYWNWKRDQERIIVKKSPVYWGDADGMQTETTASGVGIVVVNLSLYPVRIVGLGFLFDKRKSFPLLRENHVEEWPLEVASHSRMVVYANEKEWKRLVDALGHRGRIMEWGFIAVANTETGGRFASNRLSVRVKKPFRVLRRWLRFLPFHS